MQNSFELMKVFSSKKMPTNVIKAFISTFEEDSYYENDRYHYWNFSYYADDEAHIIVNNWLYENGADIGDEAVLINYLWHFDYTIKN